MMNLKVQIISFIFSFIYGIVSCLLHNEIAKYMKSKNKKIEFLNNIFFLTNLTLLYFKIFILINNGIINIYFLLITILSFVYIKYYNFTKKM